MLAEFNPSGEHLSEIAAGFVGCGTNGGCSCAFWVLGPPADEDSVVISDFFGGCTRERSIQPALKWKLIRGPCHVRIVALATRDAIAEEVETSDYDVAVLRKRRRGRPVIGSGPAEVVPVRIE